MFSEDLPGGRVIEAVLLRTLVVLSQAIRERMARFGRPAAIGDRGVASYGCVAWHNFVPFPK